MIIIKDSKYLEEALERINKKVTNLSNDQLRYEIKMKKYEDLLVDMEKNYPAKRVRSRVPGSRRSLQETRRQNKLNALNLAIENKDVDAINILKKELNLNDNKRQ